MYGAVGVIAKSIQCPTSKHPIFFKISSSTFEGQKRGQFSRPFHNQFLQFLIQFQVTFFHFKQPNISKLLQLLKV